LKESYRLRASLLALKRDGEDRPNLQTLLSETIVTVCSEVRESGLVEVLAGNDLYTLFFSDLEERGELIGNRCASSTSR
jgi:hypothetical protein